MALIEIRVYQTKDGRAPFDEWVQGLRDKKGVQKILTRVDRVALGNFGDCRSVGQGVLELRVDFGPGYRVYLGRKGGLLVILLCGGDKATQSKDIQRAHGYWDDFKGENP